MTEPGPIIDLTDAAERIRVRPGDLEAVTARARHRTRRHRRQATSLLAALAVVASVPVAQQLLAPSEGETPLAASGSVRRGSLGLEWRRVDVDPKSAIGFARGVSAGSPLYAISSAAGERMIDGRETSRVVWRSEDGIEWNAVSTLGPDLYLADLSTRDSRVYAVGTVPAQAAPKGQLPTLRASDVVVGWSDDNGRQWNRQKLAFDIAGDAPTTGGGSFAAEVAAGPKGVVAVAALWADLDVPRLLPDGATAPHGWATTATGVDILGPARKDVCPAGYTESKEGPHPGGEVLPTWCHVRDKEQSVTVTPQEARSVLASYTWEQLGVKGDLLDAVRRQPKAFYAEPGSTDFRPVELPDLAYVAGAVAVEADQHGFTLLASTGTRYGEPNEIVLLRSSDGRSWAKGSTAGMRRWTTGMGSLAGRTAAVTSDASGATLTVADGDGGWRSTVLSSALDPEDLEGRELTVGQAAFGPFGVAVHAVTVPARRDFDESSIVHRLLVSRDGETWDVLPLEDVLGEPGGTITRLTVTEDKVIVTASLPVPGQQPTPRRQVVVVGRAA